VGAALAWALVALLAALHAAPFLLTFVEGDFARDLDRATRMVEGESWPTRGPVLAWTLHLGPLWYWMLALPLAIARSVGAAVVVVAALSALQFPLAYRLGAAVAGRGAGLAFAIFLSLPGVSTLEGVWIAHPSLVPTAVLAVALCAWRAWTRRSPRWWVASMLLASLALHAHPTTLPVLALPAIAALRALRSDGRFAAGALAVGLAAFALPFAPLAFDAGANARELARFAAGVASDAVRFTVPRWLDAMASLAWRVPDAIGGVALSGRASAPPAFRLALGATYALALAGFAFALARRSGTVRPALAALAGFGVTVAVAVAVRDTTRFYMLYAAWVPFAAWLAFGASALPQHVRAGIPVRLVPVALALAISVATSGAWTLRAIGGEVRVPVALSAATDLARGVPRGYVALGTLTPFDLDRVGGRLCAAGEVRAFGELAGIVDMLRNVPARLACGGASRVVLGGVAGAGEPWYLVHAGALPPGASAERIGAFALGRAGAVHAPALPIALTTGDDYPWRRACGAPASVRVSFTVRGPGTLVVANALPVTCPLTLVRVVRDGAAVSPVEWLDSHVMAMPEGESRWEIEAATGEPRALQVYAIAAGG
jgi:hypothetical protein